MQNPILHPVAKQHQHGDYSSDEVALANRNSGTLLETLQYDTTPTGSHYLLNHFDVPFVDNASGWNLTLDGQVRNPETLTLSGIIDFAERSKLALVKRVTLECAGNGRAMLEPRWPSQPWQVEAVGTSDWYGMPLKHLLEQAEITGSGREIVFHGADKGIDNGNIHHFARSLSIEDAMHDDVMLVWQMNGQPLLPQHGFPLRLIVPGWYGMASVKWLNRIEVIDHGFTGHQQTGTYVYRIDDNDPGVPVTTIRVKSLMVPPGIPDWSSRKRLIKPGPVTLTGRAWSGGGTPVTRVEWNCDGQWQDAALEPDSNNDAQHQYAWRKWTATWHASEGQHTLSCRATDANGEVQPLEPPWDKAGFGNNAVHTVEVWCTDY